MAEFIVQHRKCFPAGTLKIELARLLATGAVSTSTSLDFVSSLRVIESAEIGLAANNASMITAAATWTNSAFAGGTGHATFTISGLTNSGNKTVEVALYGRT